MANTTLDTLMDDESSSGMQSLRPGDLLRKEKQQRVIVALAWSSKLAPGEPSSSIEFSRIT